MNNQPLISVIIPAYNAMETIALALDSVRAQTYRHYEIIVVDDGSIDGTSKFLDSQPDIHCIHQENRGLSAARNRGVAEAKGEYLAFLDSDDLWHPQKLEFQIKAAFQRPGFGLMGTKIKKVKTISKPITSHLYGAINLNLKRYGFYQLLVQLGSVPSSVIIPKKIYDETGGFAPGWPYSEDRDLWQRIAYKYPVYQLKLPLTYYYLRPNSLSREDRLKPMINNALVVEQWNTKLPNHFDVDRKIDRSKYLRAFRKVVFQYSKEILKYYPREIFKWYWGRFEYIFGHFNRLFYYYLILRRNIKYGFRHIRRRDYDVGFLEKLRN
jgi:glycosyltransferase involved in cell wall biosynthesis